MAPTSSTCRPPLPRPIQASDYADLIKNDVELYPTENPLTPAVLAKWFAHHAQFGMMYDTFGCCIFVPLLPSTWNKFIRKEIEEAALVDGIFDAATSSTGELCLHLYHIEKSSKWTRQFERMAHVVIQDVCHLIRELNYDRSQSPIRVVGCSALAVSDAGYRMSRDVFQMSLLFEPEEFLFRHRTRGHVTIVHALDCVGDRAPSPNEWEKFGEARLMAVTGYDACAKVFKSAE
ncbi:hypothetical protein H310_02958 [Aphanomyces invadans]|uniref:Uncharacterized protein n=1 Tax=Aphanomyces invadans TaxID=157072 RepID=A0A024UMG4_9STRA|nr:hypothetical protein H310_02958 [Aphanomyces invadans]ETW06808.1 hypothetical protein H310_02958 [Aphanomyces invadans]RHY32950.1 hypothetical protein DYB32_002046 [Aphanomyces invadans]|eukprot:XP_008864883.1 hypothetical protein H310_02958 [Aphanomyces invadans]